MEQLTANIFIETGLKGANHGVVTTSDGLVLIARPGNSRSSLKFFGFAACRMTFSRETSSPHCRSTCAINSAAL